MSRSRKNKPSSTHEERYDTRCEKVMDEALAVSNDRAFEQDIAINLGAIHPLLMGGRTTFALTGGDDPFVRTDQD